MKITYNQFLSNLCAGIGIFGLMKIKAYEFVVPIILFILLCSVDGLYNKE